MLQSKIEYRHIMDENGEIIGANYCITKDGKTYWEQFGETHAQFEARVNGTETTAEDVKKVMQEVIKNADILAFESESNWLIDVVYRSHYAPSPMFWKVSRVNFESKSVIYWISKVDFEYYHKNKNNEIKD